MTAYTEDIGAPLCLLVPLPRFVGPHEAHVRRPSLLLEPFLRYHHAFRLDAPWVPVPLFLRQVLAVRRFPRECFELVYACLAWYRHPLVGQLNDWRQERLRRGYDLY